jgi:transposase
MSLRPQAIPPIPEETARIAHAIFPDGNVYMRMRDQLGTLHQDQDFTELFPKEGQPAQAPWLLALVTVMQYVEGLTDRQAADAVRTRIDWKYALSLDLTDTGFDFSLLCKFRSRLLAHGAEERLLEIMLGQFRAQGWLKARGKLRTDSTHVLAAIRTLNRLEVVGETLRHALGVLAEVAPEWLRTQMAPEWGLRYRMRFSDFRLPKGTNERVALAQTIGADGAHLLQAVYACTALPWLRDLPAVQTLRRVWVQQYHANEHAPAFRADHELPPAALLINSPYDIEARYSKKRSSSWTGYKVHFTETCDPDKPHLVIQVTATTATTPDRAIIEGIHTQLAQRDLLPGQHLVDSGYVDTDTLLEAELDHQIELLGPVPVDVSWQTRDPDHFDLSHFHLDWENQTACCPAGCTSRSWAFSTDQSGKAVIHVKFTRADCHACPLRSHCTRSQARILTLRPNQQAYQTLQAARQRQQTPAFRKKYAKRAGVEGTMAQGVRVCEIRQARYIGLNKLRLQALLTATALNLIRACAWLAEGTHAGTPTSRFAKLVTSLQQTAA